MTADTETRDRILDSARSSFLQRGTSGARMQEIADEAGVNKALLHYYFKNKDTLAEAVFKREARRLVPPVMETLGSERSLEAKVRRVVALYLEVLSDAPSLPVYVFSEMHFHPDHMEAFVSDVLGGSPRERGTGVLARLQSQLDEEAEAGRVRPLKAEQFMANLISLCIFPFVARPMMQIMMAHGESDFDTFIDERREGLPEFFLKALRP